MRWHLRMVPRGIRARTTVSATVVVAVALLAASVALVVLQRRQLTDELTMTARQAGGIVIDQLAEGGMAEVDLTALHVTVGAPVILQIIAADGTVLLAGDDDYQKYSITDRRPPPGATQIYQVASLPDDDDRKGGGDQDDEPFVIVTSGVQTSNGMVRVATAAPLESVERSTIVLLTLLAIGLPLILLVVVMTTYRVVTRALKPVEEIRSRVAELSAADQQARVPVPATGDEIERLAVTMNSMLARLQAAAAAQHRFVSDASHELRSPLATIRASAELARTHPDVMAWSEGADIVLTETDRLERLVADLLLLARSDESGLIMRAEDVDLDDVVTGAIAGLAERGQIRVVVDVRSVRVTGDVQHLVRAVRNLIDNAARYARHSIEVRLRAVDGTAHLDVSDDGPGIPEAERDRVFERFVRLDASRDRDSGGSGLGLAITRQIARAHGGDVQVLPAEHEVGARLRLTLPLPQPQKDSGV